jgi:signal transduction histidine kinase
VFYTGNEELTDYPTSFSFLKELDVKEFVAAPLIARNTTIGMLLVDNHVSKQRITVDELRFLKLIAGQAGMAIENSTLYNKLEEAHTDLQDARERLLHGERLAAIGEMAANLVHELKSPLVTIGGFAGRLLKTLPDASREQHYADTILREACRLEKMLADILAFSRKPTICYSNCQMAEILRESFESCATTLEDQSIRLIQPELDDSWVVLGDAHQLKQVFLNLLLNAAESMPDGGIIKITAEEKPGPDTASLIVSISDTGGGIPAALLSKIFHPFFTTKNKGTGLGLPIVNRIISNHQGSIEAGNEGKGAVFRVTLPLKDSRLTDVLTISGM